MEKWKEIYVGSIPTDNYQVKVQNGEEFGLVIDLEGNIYNINIDFGFVSAIRMIEEGRLLGAVFDENELSRYKSNKFSNVIYMIESGQFGNFIKSTFGELYEIYGLKHYIIITMNYYIEVISEFEPSIKCVKVDR